ncbi:zinc dependent phospholipase C family protein [Azospirillum halopraeferens]|uniref:zinc dependent phospholipase C family protein n=1 Tax=Azospirillum halopraeferens TaxID=34010 RepID=UPI0004064F88|nr:zinc dependent phospholipase C family protein [Azospirillum halopraeferens]
MPKELTHILFADSVRDALPAAAAGHTADLHFGAIAPDVFYYRAPRPGAAVDLYARGEAVHGAAGEDTGAVPVAMLDRIAGLPAGEERERRAAFLCGFLTHMALDMAFHPWVVHRAGADRLATARHLLLESWLDLVMLRRAGLDLGRWRPLDAVRANGPSNRAALDLLAGALGPARGEDAAAMRRALAWQYRVQMTATRLFPSRLAARAAALADRAAGGTLKERVALFYPVQRDPLPGVVADAGAFVHPVTGAMVDGGLSGRWQAARELATAFLGAVGDVLDGRAEAAWLSAVVGRRSLTTGLPDCPMGRARHFDPVALGPLWRYGMA